jgi:hypothetical protein
VLAEPCALLRLEDAGFGPCFDAFSDRRVTLGVRLFSPCHDDVLVFGVVSPRAVSVRVLLEDGSAVDAQLFDAPRGSAVRARYFVAALPEGTLPDAVESLDAAGHSVRRGFGDIGPPVCGP